MLFDKNPIVVCNILPLHQRFKSQHYLWTEH